MSHLGVLMTLTLLAVTSAIADAHAQAPAYRSFKDWVIGCDNTRSCTALGLQPDDGEPCAFIHVFLIRLGLRNRVWRQWPTRTLFCYRLGKTDRKDERRPWTI